MKGIILAGGAGTRLYPMTKVTTKQLQPVYDKPMIYYPLSFLMLGGISDILIISTPQDLDSFKNLLGDGMQLGIKITYAVQESPTGLPDAFVLGENFINGEDVTLILGDNLFYGDMSFYRDAVVKHKNYEGNIRGRIFAYGISDPRPYGVVEFDETMRVISVEEKPSKPKSNYAIPGLYIFDGSVSERARKLEKSPRGEKEIVDLMKAYLNESLLGVQIISRGVAWLDSGTPETLLEASTFIGAIEKRQGLKVACLEEIAWRMKYIDDTGFQNLIETIPRSPYKEYLLKIRG
ncbi:MAG: glucose-1-phosphate thymidylyltransferase RfbA [Bdellovibrionota bacterium]